MLFDRYREFVPDFDGFLEALTRPLPTHLRINPARVDPAALVAGLRGAGVEVLPLPAPLGPLGVQVRGFERPGASLEWFLGMFHMQGATSMIPPLVLEVQPGDRVLDLCAAPGSKTTQLSALTGPTGCVIANEPFRDRSAILKTHLERMGCTNTCVTLLTGERFPSGMAFDRVLIDAPCSGEGTLRTDPREDLPGLEARYLADRGERARDLERLYRLQRTLLRRGANLLVPGGVLVYSTCTYDPMENERCLFEVLSTRPDLELIPVGEAFGGEPGLTSIDGEMLSEDLALTRRFYPHRAHGSFGFFCAKIRRLQGENVRPPRETVSPLAKRPGAVEEHTEALSRLARFGLTAQGLRGARLVEHGQSFWLMSPALPHPSDLAPWRPQNPGLRAFRRKSVAPKPGTFTATEISAHAGWTEQLVDLTPEQLASFFRGEPVQVTPKSNVDPGYVLARLGEHALGAGLLDGEGCLTGEIPKRYRKMISHAPWLAPTGW
ncbi:MAG: hypothetical protein ACYTFT_04155 [Planctomycetota bacterium]